MKESEIIKIKRQNENLVGQMHAVIDRLEKLNNFVFGTLETVKRMPGYDEAIEKLKEEVKGPN